MLNQNIIEIKNISKIYKLYPKKTDILWDFFSNKSSFHSVSVLEDISIDIKKGEVVGIVGENGAGKSTLLKIIAKTIPYTNGTIKVSGKVNAILELGTGFHPDFSGRDNIYFAGLCIGMSREEISGKLNSIIEFSELEAVIDQPFRTYSSGMQARLTFSTVVNADPDILIIDEALSVGDARFQLKSFQKIREFRERNKTIILVSHDHNTITGFCDRAILLHKGKMFADGEPNLVCEMYHKLLFGSKEEQVDPVETIENESLNNIQINPAGFENQCREYRFGTNEAEVIDCYIVSVNSSEKISLLYTGNKYRFCIRMIAHVDLDKFCVGLVIRTSKGVDLFGIDTDYQRNNPLPSLKMGEILEVSVEVTMWLAAGVYFATVGIADPNGLKYDLRYDALEFNVIGAPQLYTTSIINLDEKISFSVFSPSKVAKEMV